MLSLIIPTFNEKENVELLIPQLVELLQDTSFEIIVVDDNSPDGTAKCVRKLAKKDMRIRVVERRGRKGLASACIKRGRSLYALGI